MGRVARRATARHLAPELRLAAPEAARRRHARHPPARLRRSPSIPGDRPRPLRAAARAGPRSRRPERVETLRRALELWRGEALADFLRAVRRDRGRAARRARLATSRSGSTPSSRLGRDASLVGELEALVADHPLRERLRGQLMLALYRRAARPRRSRRTRACAAPSSTSSGSSPARRCSSCTRDPAAGGVTRAGRAAPPAEDHFAEVVKAILAGRLVPVLGSDVGELAARLADVLRVPGEAAELTRVSQYVAMMQGSGPLCDELHTLLETARSRRRSTASSPRCRRSCASAARRTS